MLNKRSSPFRRLPLKLSQISIRTIDLDHEYIYLLMSNNIKIYYIMGFKSDLALTSKLLRTKFNHIS